ncbi:ammonia-dependent NAD(+) synthetase [Noviherbaspirillum sp. 1P10PC]
MDKSFQNGVRHALGMAEAFDAKTEVARRVIFLADYLKKSGCNSYVLGISGGVDSTTCGMLAQRACTALRSEGYDCRFIAMRLPYGQQRDEREAQFALTTIQPDEMRTANIATATDAIISEQFGPTPPSGWAAEIAATIDFVKGNIKARQRMVVQYAIAGESNGLVLGTDHAAEALMGFFTKFGDGACDVAPLSGLNKRQVRELARYMGIPEVLVMKVPTADLEDLDPGKPDEKAYGVTYDVIDDYLEGMDIPVEYEKLIVAQYLKTQHKRMLPVFPLRHGYSGVSDHML